MYRASLVAPLLILSLSMSPAFGESASDDDVPRTSSGRPDLSGNYDISTLTPFQRRPEHGERRAFTADEVAEIQGGAAERQVSQYLPSDPDRAAPPREATSAATTPSSSIAARVQCWSKASTGPR